LPVSFDARDDFGFGHFFDFSFCVVFRVVVKDEAVDFVLGTAEPAFFEVFEDYF
jgi:hypothetical protein